MDTGPQEGQTYLNSGHMTFKLKWVCYLSLPVLPVKYHLSPSFALVAATLHS